MNTLIPAPALFNFDECLVFLGRSNNECLHLIEDGELYKLLEIEGQSILLRISVKEEKFINVRLIDSSIDKKIIEKVEGYVIDWLDLRNDLAPFYKLARKDTILKKLVREYKGLSLIGIPDLFEAVCWAIIGQHINLNFAYKLKRSFVEKFGKKFVNNNKVYWLFPKSEDIAKVKVNELMKLQFTGKKAEYIIEFAKEINKDSISKSDLLKNDYKTAKSKLLKLHGVGEWTADYVLMKCCRFNNAFPIGDVGLHNALKQNLGLDHKPTIKEILKMSSSWKNWEAYATFYLWRSLI